MIRSAASADLPRILELYDRARAFMAENGNKTQWANGHPSEAVLSEDLKLGNRLYVICDENEICGVFALIPGEDPTYSKICGAWTDTSPYGTVHRIAGFRPGGGIFREAIAFCRLQIPHLRIDTHEDNRIMQHLIEAHGFQKCGIIHLADGSPRIAYEWSNCSESEKHTIPT